MLWSSITGSNRLPWILGNRYSQLYDHFLWFVVIHSALSYGVWFQSIIWRLFLIAELAWDINRPIFCKQVRSTFRGEGAATHRLFVAQLLQKSAFCLWIILVFLIMTYVVFSRKCFNWMRWSVKMMKESRQCHCMVSYLFRCSAWPWFFLYSNTRKHEDCGSLVKDIL